MDVVKKIFASLPKPADAVMQVLYLGAPKYQLRVVADDFKKADKALEVAVDAILSAAKETHSVAEFARLEN
jgi:translation initiation factor 2 alpha subunit (eIF-2alpha)